GTQDTLRGVVTAAGLLADGLMTNTSRQVGTQAYAGLTEVVESGQSAVLTLDVLVGRLGANVVVLAIGQGQLHVIGQKVAKATAELVAFVMSVAAGGIREVAVDEELAFDSTLTLRHNGQRRSCQHGTDDNTQGI